MRLLTDTGPEDKKTEEIDLLIDKMRNCLTKEPENFQKAMTLFLQMEVHIYIHNYSKYKDYCLVYALFSVGEKENFEISYCFTSCLVFVETIPVWRNV